MSLQTPAWYQPWYSDQVKTRLQHAGFRLKNIISPADKIVGNEAHWRIAGAIAATLWVRGNDAVPANAARDKVVATMETWQAFDYVYEDDLEKMTVTERDKVAEAGAMALGRRFDLQVMGELNTRAAAASVTDTTNGMTLSNALLLCEAAQNSSAVTWDGQWYCGLPPRLFNQLLAFRQFSSSDFVGADLPFVKATTTRFWNGVNWFMLPATFPAENANVFPVPAANQAEVFLWHKACVGYGTNYDVRATVTWNNEKSAWGHNMRMAGQARVFLTEGVVRGRFSTNSAITPN